MYTSKEKFEKQATYLFLLVWNVLLMVLVFFMPGSKVEQHIWQEWYSEKQLPVLVIV